MAIEGNSGGILSLAVAINSADRAGEYEGMASAATDVVQIRAAVAADAPAIRRLVRAAWLNPLDLDWRRFLVAERAGRIVGTIQVRRHNDGTHELASLAVLPGEQGAGCGAALIAALREREAPPLYIYCAPALVGYYERFGFRPVAIRELPPGLRIPGQLARAIALIGRGCRVALPRPVFMRLDAPSL